MDNKTSFTVRAIAHLLDIDYRKVKEVREWAHIYLVIFYKGRPTFISKKRAIKEVKKALKNIKEEVVMQGSPKQIAWAESIREEIITKYSPKVMTMEFEGCNYPEEVYIWEEEYTPDAIHNCMAKFWNITDAKWWIENRFQFKRGVSWVLQTLNEARVTGPRKPMKQK